LAFEDLLDLLANRFSSPLTIHVQIGVSLAHLDGVLVDELRSLDSDLLSTAVSNDTIGRIIIERLDRASVAVIAIGVHRPEQFLDNVPFLNFLVLPPIPKRSILPTVPNYGC